MEFNIPKKLKVGSVDYEVKIVEHCGDDDFGLFKCCQSVIEISNKAGGYEVPKSRQQQTFFHELTHAILFAMRKDNLYEDESFVNTFASFLSEAISTMEESYDKDKSRM